MASISVIVPVYNVENYISECIDSVLAQTHKEYELLLINDGSTDRSGKICDEYAKEDKRIKVYHRENGGVGAARNFGLSVAAGEYVVFLDSDDWISPTFFRDAIKACDQENADVYLAGFSRAYPDKRESAYLIRQDIKGYSDELSEEDYVDLFKNNYIVSCWAKLIKRAALDGMEFEHNSEWGEDLRFSLALFRKHLSIVAKKSRVYYYRVGHASLISAVSMNKSREFVRTYQLLYKEGRNRGFKQGMWQQYLDNRLYEDILFYEQRIIQNKRNLFEKTKLLKMLLSMQQVKENVMDPACLRHLDIYGRFPLLLILRYRIS